MKIGQIHKNKLLVAPEVGAAGGGSSRSILRFVDIDTADVFEAVAELFEDEKMSVAAVESTGHRTKRICVGRLKML